LFNEQLLTEPLNGASRMSSPTPADVLARRRHLILTRDADGFADLFSPDAVMEAPYAPPGIPARLEGREAIREHSRRVMASPLRLDDYEVAELHQAQNPEVVIAEMQATGVVTTTGWSFRTRSIQVLRIREGQIVLLRDFADLQALDEALAGSGHPPGGTAQVSADSGPSPAGS
jgi:ketosteroid isomerase-like protein